MHTLDDDNNGSGLTVRNIHTLKSAVLLSDAEKYDELSKFLPEPDHPEYSLRLNWITHLITHKFTVSADFIAQVRPLTQADFALYSIISGILLIALYFPHHVYSYCNTFPYYL
jgi:hypothetical protein